MARWFTIDPILVMFKGQGRRLKIMHAHRSCEGKIHRRKRFSAIMHARRIEYIMSGGLICQSNSSKGRGHDHLPKLQTKNGKMLISQPVTSCLTNHSELRVSRLLNNQSRLISVYRLQWRPPFVGKFSVSSALLTSAGPVKARYQVRQKLGRLKSRPEVKTVNKLQCHCSD